MTGRHSTTASTEDLDKRLPPLVYSCSGYTPIAQFANDLAVTAHRTGLAEMSCIAGVGGNVPSLVSKARSGRRIVAVDGCPLHCVKHCLQRVGIEATLHVTLTADYRLGKSLAGETEPTAVEAARSDVLRRIGALVQASAEAPVPAQAGPGGAAGDSVDE